METIDTFVIVPTYNEADNIDDLVQQLLDLPVKLGVIVVDDNSPDGTGQMADAWAKRQPHRVYVVHRPGKMGLGRQNVRIFKNLAPADQVAYSRALFGQNPNATFAVALDAENFSRCGGCTREAIEQVFDREHLKATYYNPTDALINKDPRMRAALREYAAAMRGLGFEYDHPDEVEAEALPAWATGTDGVVAAVRAVDRPAEKEKPPAKAGVL